MKSYSTEFLRNIALTANAGAGKTSLAEAMLFVEKAIDRLGRVEDGNTVSDYDPEEQRRMMSINAALLPVETKTHKINVLDLPGRRDFIGEIRNCLRVSDLALMVVDANAPVEGGIEMVWEVADEFKVPRAIFINKMDKERASLQAALDRIKSTFQAIFVPITLPVGSEANLSGVIDLLRMKVVKDVQGKRVLEDIPADMMEAAESARASLVEAAAEGDDALMEKFFSEGELTPEEVSTGLRAAVAEGRAIPVLCGSSTKMIGVGALNDFIVSTAPSPLDGPGLALENGNQQKVDPNGPMSAYVFKTVSDDYAGRLNFFKVMTGQFKPDTPVINTTKDKSERIGHVLTLVGKKSQDVGTLQAGDIGAVSKLDVTGSGDTLCDTSKPVKYLPTKLPQPTCIMAISAKSKAEEEKIGVGMHRMIEQDPTLKIHRESETAQTILSGMGDTHLDVAVSRLKNQSKVEVDLSVPRVAYRETLTKSAQGQGKYKKQSGGRGQYGDCWLKFEPNERGAGFEFNWEVVGGVVPTKYAPAIEKGLVEALQRGLLSGCPMVDVKAACYDGTYHNVDSSEMAFKVAASMAFKNVAPNAGPIIMEPIMNVTIRTPDEYMGDIMGDLNSKRGRIMGMEQQGKYQLVKAQVPLAEMFNYSRELRSITQDRGTFEMEFSHYEQTPSEVQMKIVEEAAKRKQDDED